ncbi:MAG: MarR family winged helix-turn-helix transcriptional regulator [Geminicoccaceae bacterium]
MAKAPGKPKKPKMSAREGMRIKSVKITTHRMRKLERQLDREQPAEPDPRHIRTGEAMIESIAAILEHVGGPTSLMTLQTLFEVASKPGQSVIEITESLGQKQSTVSGQLLDLGRRGRDFEPGAQLVEVWEDPTDLRRREYRLTEKGEALMDRIADAFEGIGSKAKSHKGEEKDEDRKEMHSEKGDP